MGRDYEEEFVVNEVEDVTFRSGSWRRTGRSARGLPQPMLSVMEDGASFITLPALISTEFEMAHKVAAELFWSSNAGK